MGKTGVVLIKEFFGTERPVTMDELKAFTAAERAELAQEVATYLGLHKIEGNPVTYG